MTRPNPFPSRWPWLCATARIAAVYALIARATANHDRPARRARRRVLLILNRGEWRGRRLHCRRRDHRRIRGWRQRMTVAVGIVQLAPVHAGVKLRFG